MKISGFSYVRNGFDYGVPFLEAIKSALPICDEFIIAVGDSNDGTREAITNLKSDKIRIIDTIWDPNLKRGGKIFAQQTNIALDQITGDWAFHIQADEVIHENQINHIKKAIDQYNADSSLDGFILPFLHFWGGYNYCRNSRRVHNFEVRVFRNNIGVRSYRDSQGFRKYKSKEGYENNSDKGGKLRVKLVDAVVYHYNGVRPPAAFRKKAQMFGEQYLEKEEVEKQLNKINFDWNMVDRVVLFKGEHPCYMQEKVNAQNWEYSFDKSKARWKLKDRIIQPIEDLIGFKFGEYKNYKLI
jgi:hypothetical protein